MAASISADLPGVASAVGLGEIKVVDAPPQKIKCRAVHKKTRIAELTAYRLKHQTEHHISFCKLGSAEKLHPEQLSLFAYLLTAKEHLLFFVRMNTTLA